MSGAVLQELSVMRECAALLCGERINWGQFRTVFECALDPDWVVKVEDGAGNFQNVLEWEAWQEFKDDKAIGKWLAPCHYISPTGIVLIQSKTMTMAESEYPKKVPAVFTDLKLQNWGRLPNTQRAVCHDYAKLRRSTPVGMRGVKWWSDR